MPWARASKRANGILSISRSPILTSTKLVLAVRSCRLASRPREAGVVDKVEEFSAELANLDTSPEERIVALKFPLHFIGDVHQPLHAADNRDRGGNDERASAPGFRAGNLHHFWDTEFVQQLGPDLKSIAAELIGQYPFIIAAAVVVVGRMQWLVNISDKAQQEFQRQDPLFR